MDFSHKVIKTLDIFVELPHCKTFIDVLLILYSDVIISYFVSVKICA